MQQACTAAGYGDLPSFRRLFKRHTDVSPAAYRTQFAGMTFDRAAIAAR